MPDPHPDHLTELDRILGPVAVLDLQHRHLLGRPGPIGTPALPAGADARKAAVLDAVATNPVAAAWAGALREHGRGAAPAFAARLPQITRGGRSAGKAVRASVSALRAGTQWHAAAPASFGSAALARAVADGAHWADDPWWRPLSAGLGTVVTHAHPRAVAGGVVVAEAIARLLAEPDTDLVALAGELAGEVPDDPELSAALRDLPSADTRETRATVLEVLPLAFALAAAGRSGRRVRGGGESLPLLVDALRAASAPGAGPPPDRARPEPVHAWFLLDRSGSMQSMHEGVIAGFNRFLDGQRAAAGGELRLTLVQFDSQDVHDVVFGAVPIAEVLPMAAADFEPRAMTPLFDAIGRLIDAAEEAERDGEDVIVAILTDGLENHSRHWDHSGIFDRIAEKQAQGWTFVFLGANQDSYATGGGLGVSAGNTSNFAPSPAGMQAAWSSLDRSVGSYRLKARARRRRDREEFFEGVKEAEQ